MQEVRNRSMVDSEAGEMESDDKKAEFAGEEEKNLAPPSPAADMLIDTEETEEKLVFSDEEGAFPSLSDFACFSSPSASASHSSAASTLPNQSTSSSSSSSSSSPWSFLRFPTESDAHAMQPAAASTHDDSTLIPITDAGFDIIGDGIIDHLSWDSSPFFFLPDEGGSGGAEQQVATEEKEGFLCGGDDCTSSEDLADVFLDWLKKNKDSISPEDLRSIKLKRSTIECAARRLGGGKQGRVQLLKLILDWVQNHHLQKRRRRSRGSEATIRDDQELHNYAPPPPPAPFPPPFLPPINTNLPLPLEATASNPNIDFHYAALPCNSWMPFAGESSFPTVMPPYHYYQDQTFSAEPWQQGLSSSAASTSAAVQYSPFGQTPPSTSLQYLPPPVPVPVPVPMAVQYQQCLPVYTPGQMTTATKEARKKRMARHRKSSSLHHHRSQQQQSQQQQSSDTVVVQEESSSNCSFLSSLPAMKQMKEKKEENSLHGHTTSTSSGDRRREGIKAENNYKFLLRKVLKQSDVGSLGRIVLPKKEAEIHLPELDTRDGISIEMEDIGSSRVWNMRYRFWPNNKSRMYLLENTVYDFMLTLLGDFVRSNGLQEGDFIVLYSDVKCGKYMIRGVKVRQPVDMMKGASNRNSGKAHQKKEKSSSTMAVSQQQNDKGKSPCTVEY